MKTSIIFFCCLFISLLLISVRLSADTLVPTGQVSGTWTLDGSPYLIQGYIEIPSDSTLVIEPGVVVEFQGHYTLQVQGKLLAIGTEHDSILFTVNDTTGFSDPDTSLGGWNGIRFTDTPQHNDSSKIVYCELLYGKAFGPVWHLNAGGAICVTQFDKLLISNCLIKNNWAVSSTEEIPIGGGIYLFDSDVIIRDNILSNNRAAIGGAVFFDSSNPVFSNNIFENNTANEGGAIGMGGTCYPIFNGGKILNNIATNHGGGIILWSPSMVTCNNLTFSGNKAIWGGGVGVQGGELVANDCQFTDNRVELWGGGIAGDFATLHLNKCTFTKDTSGWGSGGLHMDHAIAEINDCEFVGNNAVFGGGFHSVYSEIAFNQTDFLYNLAEAGAGLHIEDSDLNITECVLQGNYATNGSGGAIDYNVDTTIFGRPNNLQITKCTIDGNSASNQSGGLQIEQINSEYSLVDILVDRCEFVNNQANTFSGLRIAGSVSDFTLSNSLFRSNTSSSRVGGAGFQTQCSGKVYNCIFSCNYSSFSDSSRTAHGVSLGNEAKVDFFNCTFFDSSDADGIGLSARRGSEAKVVNSIFWGCGNNPISVTTAADLGCTLTVIHCDIENGIDSVYVSDSLSTLHWGIGNFDLDPLFVDVQNMDFHLQDISPCIGSGTNCILLDSDWHCCPTSDIDGNARPYPDGSYADMGAYENTLGAPLGMEHAIEEIPSKFFLSQNYPNPFNPRTVIRYTLPVTCYADISVYNILGQKLATLVSQKQSAGDYNVEWDAADYASGIYLYKLSTDQGFAQTKKLIVLK
jgi:parallel beta-helix repeat protein